ncbi:MAG: polysaccharide biosynthesis C-terminal domain-containing protein [Oscillospiraceae bacterium]|nr:polysaccharide biosynthesis C-terminal domain-containing protein [Oscillospiraceae bacterium]
MPRKMPIFYSALMLTGVNLLLRLVSTSFQVYISGRIGAAGVGLLQLVLSVGMLALTAGMAGVRTATMYLTAEELGHKRPQNVGWVLSGCFLYSILCSGLIAMGLYFFAPVLASQWIGDIQTVGAIRTLSAFLPITCLCGCMTGYFTAANRIGTLAAVEVAEQLLSMAVTMAALSFWAGTDAGRACQAVVLGSGVGACLTLICLMLLRIRERADTGPRIRISHRLLETAVPLALADDLKAGISSTENLMVPKRLSLYPGVQNPLAAFGTICGMVFPVMMFPAAILFGLAELLIPELARCAAAGSQRRIGYLVRRSLRVAMLYGFLCSGILFLIADKLCAALYDNQEAGTYLQLYALLIPMLYCDCITDAMTKGLGQQKICVRYNILTSSMDVAFLYLLLPRYGMNGYFFSFLVTHLLNFILSLRLLFKISGTRISPTVPVFAFAAAGAAVWAASFLSATAGRCIGFVLIFGCLLILLKVLHKEDLQWLKGLFRI